MEADKQSKDESKKEKKISRRLTKKDQIISLFLTGISEIEEIGRITRCRSSYIASVLQRAGLITGYFDLYTSTNQTVNIYSRFFAGKLGFKDLETAYRSVSMIDRLYRQFESTGDRAGQHHALMMALTMFNRARWTNKKQESDVFRTWLIERLEEVRNKDDFITQSEL